MNQRLLKTIIKQVLLTEAPIDVWKAKNRSLPSEQLSQAEKYFVDLTGKYNALLHPIAKDLTKLNFEQLETLYKAVEMAKNKNLKTPFVQWLTKQLKQLPDLSLQQVIEDYIPPLLSLQKNKEKFEPNFLQNLESIEQLNQALNQKVSSDDLAVSEEQLGKIAEENGWILYMPHTTEASCEIGKTGGRRDTTWCTTRSDSSNMFLNYTANSVKNIILFYVVKKGINAETNPFAKMSIGFIDGKPLFDNGDGGVSVNADNGNLTQKKFEQVLGEDLADKFLGLMQEKASSLGGEHPSKEEFRKLIKNPKALRAKIDSFAKDENGQELRTNFINSVFDYRNFFSPETLNVLAGLIEEDDAWVRREVAQHPTTPSEILNILVKDTNLTVREEAAAHPNLPIETLNDLANDKEPHIRKMVAGSLKAFPKTLNFLAADKNYDVRMNVASNPNTPPETLNYLVANNTHLANSHITQGVAKNPSTPSETLSRLTQSNNIDIKMAAVSNPSTPPETLSALAETKLTGGVLKAIAGNPSTPPETLSRLVAKHQNNVFISSTVAINPNTPIETLNDLANNTDSFVRSYVAINPSTPPTILSKLGEDADHYVRLDVALNKNTPIKTLNLLAADTSYQISNAASQTLKIKSNNLTETLMLEKIINEKTPPKVLAALSKDKYKNVRNAAVKTLNVLKTKPVVEAIIMEKVWRKLLKSI
jgi:hypothetical protein